MIKRLPNHSLHRTPPRNVLGEATTSGCIMPGARLRDGVESGAGELKKRWAEGRWGRMVL